MTHVSTILYLSQTAQNLNYKKL